MTNLQAEYTKILETRRHNEATEAQSSKSLEIEARKADESARHNQATESLTASEQALKSAIAKMENATKLYTTEQSLLTDKQLKAQDLEYKRWSDNLNNALKKMELEFRNRWESGKLDLSKKEFYLKAVKTKADIQNMIDRIMLEYDKSWKATATKAWRGGVTGLANAVNEKIDALEGEGRTVEASLLRSLWKKFGIDLSKSPGDIAKDTIYQNSILGTVDRIEDVLTAAAKQGKRTIEGVASDIRNIIPGVKTHG